MIPVLVGAARFQLQTFRSNPECLMSILLVPFQTIVFMSLVQYANRPELTGYAILAPAVIAVMMMAILESGELISRDRGLGSFEALLAIPVNPPVIILVRTTVVTLVSLLAIAESWLTATLLFGADVAIAHPLVFTATLIATAVGVAGAATTMSATFILSRSARTFQNSISYPILLLGGAFVPVDLLPGWHSGLFHLLLRHHVRRDRAALHAPAKCRRQRDQPVHHGFLRCASATFLLARDSSMRHRLPPRQSRPASDTRPPRRHGRTSGAGRSRTRAGRRSRLACAGGIDIPPPGGRGQKVRHHRIRRLIRASVVRASRRQRLPCLQSP